MFDYHDSNNRKIYIFTNKMGSTCFGMAPKFKHITQTHRSIKDRAHFLKICEKFGYMNDTSMPFSSYMSYKTTFSQKHTFDFFIKFYNDNVKHREELIHKYSNFSGKFFSESYKDLIDKTCSNKSEISQILNPPHYNINYIEEIELLELEQYLETKGFTSTEYDELLFEYVKRQKEYLTASTEVKLREYLLNKFDYKEEPLTPYFDIIPSLAIEFKEIDPSLIFEANIPYSTTTIVDCAQLKNIFGIRDWKLDNYKKTIEFLAVILKDKYQLNKYFLEGYKDPKDVSFGVHLRREDTKHKISFLHNNEHFNKDILEKNIISLFAYIRKQELSHIDLEYVETWFNFQNIKKEIIEKEPQRSKFKV